MTVTGILPWKVRTYDHNDGLIWEGRMAAPISALRLTGKVDSGAGKHFER